MMPGGSVAVTAPLRGDTLDLSAQAGYSVIIDQVQRMIRWVVCRQRRRDATG